MLGVSLEEGLASILLCLHCKVCSDELRVEPLSLCRRDRDQRPYRNFRNGLCHITEGGLIWASILLIFRGRTSNVEIPLALHVEIPLALLLKLLADVHSMKARGVPTNVSFGSLETQRRYALVSVGKANGLTIDLHRHQELELKEHVKEVHGSLITGRNRVANERCKGPRFRLRRPWELGPVSRRRHQRQACHTTPRLHRRPPLPLYSSRTRRFFINSRQ